MVPPVNSGRGIEQRCKHPGAPLGNIGCVLASRVMGKNMSDGVFNTGVAPCSQVALQRQGTCVHRISLPLTILRPRL